MTRWICSAAGGLAYLMAVLWLDVVTAIILSAACGLLIATARVKKARLMRGLRGLPGESSRAELGHPAAATIALAFGWGLGHDAWPSFVAIAFMAWGDASAGLVRWAMRTSGYQTIAAWLTMLSVCVAVAWLSYPHLAGLVAAVVASVAETLWPLTGYRISDNWPVVGSGLGLMIVLGGN